MLLKEIGQVMDAETKTNQSRQINEREKYVSRQETSLPQAFLIPPKINKQSGFRLGIFQFEEFFFRNENRMQFEQIVQVVNAKSAWGKICQWAKKKLFTQMVLISLIT
jgi:hypothetical protein